MDWFEFELEQYVCTWSAPPAIATSGLHTECLLVESYDWSTHLGGLWVLF